MKKFMHLCWLAIVAAIMAPAALGADTWYSATPQFWDQGKAMVQKHGLKPIDHPRTQGIKIGDKEVFNTINVGTNQIEQTEAVLRRIGEHCYIYVEVGTQMSEQTIDKLLTRFEKEIYPTNHRYFGSEWKPGVDYDPRLTLLFLDIKDGWMPGKGYVGGYFYPLDEFSKRVWPTSNEREMVYLDTYPSDPTKEDYLGILAHEFQHMIHFNYDPQEDVWLNEAMAQIAFYANDFGHPSQILWYLKQNAFSLDKFKENGVLSYGFAYLWLYYLTTQYLGSTEDEQAENLSRIVQSKLHGMDSIQALLTERGVKKPLSEIFLDFSMGNLLGNEAFAKQGLKFRVQPQQVFAAANLPNKPVKGQLGLYESRYFSVMSKVNYLPIHPTMTDQIRIFAPKDEGMVAWTINDGQLPPASMIPEGSTVDNDKKVVLTPIKNFESGHGIILGPFVRKGVKVDQIICRFMSGNETSPALVIPVFSLPELAKAAAQASKSSQVTEIEISASGSKNLRAYALIECANGSTRNDLAFKGSKARMTLPMGCTGSDLIGVHFGLSTFGAKKVPFTVAFRARKALESSAAMSASVDEGVQPASSTATAAMKRMAALAAKEAEQSANDDEDKIMRDIQKELKIVGKGDDQDKSHDNVGYFTARKAELAYDLTHLQIAPEFEQLVKLWRVLEIVRGFPHLPVPDGFAIKDYNEKHTISMLKHWADQFKVEYPFEKKFGKVDMSFPAPAKGSEEQVKETLRRMAVSEALIDFAYTNGLTLASDTALSIYEFVRFIVAVQTSIKLVAGELAKVPVVGDLIKRVSKLIQAKLLNVIQNFSYWIADRLKPPANIWVPILVNYAANVYARVMGIDYDPEPWPGYDNKELVVALFGRYALESVPKIGYVDRSQAALDLHNTYAAKLDYAGTYADVVKKVIDDGDPTDFGSARETILKEVINRHRMNYKERQLARVGTRLTQVFQLAGTIDPTNITKILAIASGLATTGILAHSTHLSLGYMLQLSDKGLKNAVHATFHPEKSLELVGTTTPRRSTANRELFAQKTKSLESAFDQYLSLIGKGAGLENAEDREVFIERLEVAEEGLDTLMSETEALAAPAMEEGDSSLMNSSQDVHLQRASVLSGVLSELTGTKSAATDSDALRKSVGSYLGRINMALSASKKLDASEAAVLHVEKIKTEKSWLGKHSVTATIVNLGTITAKLVSAELISGLTYSLDGEKSREIGMLKPGQRTTVTWKLSLSDYDKKKIPVKMVGVVLKGQDLVEVSKMANLLD